jgi:NAD(P)-dependent dehydrogenase (short-subunit alcohol dehydrogenase family)
MTGRIVIAGASGFIGRFLAAAFIVDGATVSFIGRSGADARWGDTARIAAILDGADLLVNLAGKSVNCRYNETNRAEILRSRVETTRELGEAIRSCERPPALWVNSSTATIYRHAEDRPMTEADGEIGAGFSVDVATAWEREFFAGELPGTRRVALRMAIVLGNGGALIPMLRLARFGLGGPQLDGHWFATAARGCSRDHPIPARASRHLRNRQRLFPEPLGQQDRHAHPANGARCADRAASSALDARARLDCHRNRNRVGAEEPLGDSRATGATRLLLRVSATRARNSGDRRF